MRTSPQIFVGDCLIGRLCSRRVLMWRVERDSQSRTACRILQRHRERICIRTCSDGQSFLMASVWVETSFTTLFGAHSRGGSERARL